MKKILSLIVLISSLFALAACQSAFSNTKVRVVELSYRTSAEELASVPSNNSMRLHSNKLLADEVKEYIFPGDVLTFTVELEDPNFEFISLLSIKFNDNIIRANVDNSIVTTRDCGANICVDFPFEITADKSEYSVQEVKFAKLNSDNGVNAIIDNQTSKTVEIDIYNGMIYPYVLESVQTLNSAIQNMEYYEDGKYFDNNIWNLISIPEYGGRTFYISDYSGTKEIVDLQIGSDDRWSVIVENGEFDSEYYINQYFVLTYIDYGYGNQYIHGPRIHFCFYESKYKNAYFYNDGNSIYLDLLGERYFIIELKNSMRIIYFEPIPYPN